MTGNEKQLLIKDLCARLPYEVKILYTGWDNDRGFEYQIIERLVGVDANFIYTLWGREKNKHSIKFADFKPYLRPMSSMTEEEKNIYEYNKNSKTNVVCIALADWLNEHHFDYRNLIEKGLALEASEDMYKTE